MIKFYNQIDSEIEFSIKYIDDIDISTIVKNADFKFNYTSDTLLEKIVDNLEISRKYLSKKIYVFVNLLDFLEIDEVKKIIKEIEYKGYIVLLLQNKTNELIKKEIKNITLDEDLCLI